MESKDMNAVTVLAPAKINLLLDVIRRLPNGYHSLFMVMQSVGLFDEITVEKAKAGISLECSEKSLPTDGKNLAYRAAELFYEESGIAPGARVTVRKNIPLQAGLAGGSADAAGVLLALDELYGRPLGADRLREAGFSLGADVPFCVSGGLMLSQDAGQVLSPLPKIKEEVYFVLAKPEAGVSTKEAYEAFDSAENVRHPDCASILHHFAGGRFFEALEHSGNVFEQFIEVPERVEIKARMRSFGAAFCCMSGSGPTVFGVFREKDKAEACAKELRKTVRDVFTVLPADGPVFADARER